MMATPLDGIRVLDASTGIAGPMAAMYLADFGADVVKVEPPRGEPGRADAGFAMWNRNKRGIVIDDAKASDRERLLGLLRGADVCIFSETLASLQRRGLDPETLQAENGRLVYLHMPPFTESAPWAGEQESAAMIEAATGVAREQYGFEDVPIDGLYPHVLYAQAMWGATAATSALIEREASGAGQTVTVGGLHGMLMAMTGQVTHIPGAEHMVAPGGPGGNVPFYRLYRGNDEQWLFMATLTPAFFLAAFDQLGVLDMMADDRLGGDPMAMALPENAPWLIERIQQAFKARARDEWREILSGAGCPNGPVNDRETWLDHPQIVATGMRVEVEDPERGTVVMPGLPLNLSETPASVRTAAPSLGQHDAEVGEWPAQAPAVASGGSAATDGVGRGPLTGLRVLDLGSIIAGTYAGSLMAELGADVIKVEAPGGDNLRAFGPTFTGYNKGKRSIAVDLRGEAGRGLFLDLVKGADMVVDNYRMGVLERLGIDYASLKEANPEIITVSVTGYGEGGPMDTDPGFDPILQAWSGMMKAQGGDSDPVFFTLPVNDISSACTAALGGLLALLHRKRGGAGQRVWTSLAAQSCMMQSRELVRFAGRTPAHWGGADYPGPGALDRYYAASDGWVRLQAVHAGIDDTAENRHAAVARLQKSRFLPPEVVEDEATLAAALGASIGGMRAAEAERALHAAGVPAMRARTLEELSTDPLFEGTETVHLKVPAEQPPGGAVSLYSVGRYARFSRTEQSAVLFPPGLGEHTLAVLGEAGHDAKAAAELVEAGVVVVGDRFVVPPLP